MLQEECGDLYAPMVGSKSITVNDDQVTINLYGVEDAKAVCKLAISLIQSIATEMARGKQKNPKGSNTSWDIHNDVVIDCIAMSCGKTKQWVIDLDDISLIALKSAWWEVCGFFFLEEAKRLNHGKNS